MFSNKVVIISGSFSGVGLATAKLFLQNGAKVTVMDKNAEKREDVLQELSDISDMGAFLVLNADISKEKDVKDTINKTLEKFGGIDVLVNNAGTPLAKTIMETTLDEWNEVFATNSTGTFLMSRETVKWMIANNKEGSIVSVASVCGKTGSALATAYSGSKGSVIAFTKALAKEVARYRINVNCVCPGAVDTPMFWEGTIKPLPKILGNTEEVYVKSILSTTPLKRLLQPEEVSDLIAYLASDRAKGITGQAYTISCGLEMC